MAGEWKEGRLADFAEVVMGTSPPGATTNDTGQGMPLLNGPTEFTSHSPMAVQHTTAPVKSCEPGDILFCVRGSTTGRMNWADRQYAIGRGLAAIRHRDGTRYQHYVRAVMEFGLLRLLAVSTGSTFPSVSRSDIENVAVCIPPLREQQAIACILGALDDKIELNRRRNRTLEGMARAIFQSWFVDFDPVKAKAAGRTPPGLKPELAALFPDSFQDSPLGPIPHGWDVKTVADVTFRVTKGDTPRSEAIKAASENERWIPMLRVNAITDEGEILIDKAERIPESIHFGKSKRSILEPNDILYTNAGTIGRIAFVQPEFLPANTNQAIAIVKPDPNLIPPCYLYMTLRRPAFQEELHKDIVQAVQANLALGKISEAKFIRPPEDLVERLFFPVNSILNQIWHSRKQSCTLSDLRNTLLPKLIAGEFRVPDAEKIIGRAL